jgi:hypothetical protein
MDIVKVLSLVQKDVPRNDLVRLLGQKMSKFKRIFCCRRCGISRTEKEVLDTETHALYISKGIVHRCQEPNEYGILQQVGYDLIDTPQEPIEPAKLQEIEIG